MSNPMTWEEALRLNGTPGYTRQECLQEAEKLLTLRREGGGAVRRSWVILDRQEQTCETHGAYESKLEQLQPVIAHPMFKPRWTTCPVCDREIDAEQKAKLPMSADMKRTMENFRMAEAGVPSEYLSKTVESFRGSHAATLAKFDSQVIAAVDAGRSLVVCGPAGTGKTHISCAILRTVIVKHYGTGKYLTQSRMMSRLKATMEKNGEREETVWKDLLTVDLLVLDEVGKGNSSDWEKSQLFRLIDERYSGGGKSMIVCSNLTKAELHAYLGDHGWRRLARDSEFEPKESRGVVIELRK